ncbi:hypothetical protein Psuf_061990 [Phytohabitans suffuscus]|uniref:Uncharacterized protein n=1 Tax=Phytohabitans suffuscus TaxID=624315 RepID=A0A6F8YS52_9ACTN|nr:hypothetical protein Psuf_061990 [Phytohabitans suffuscus]
MSIAPGLEVRRRKRQHKRVLFPATVLACAVALSISAQVVEAERSVVGWIAAAYRQSAFGHGEDRTRPGYTKPAQPRVKRTSQGRRRRRGGCLSTDPARR